MPRARKAPATQPIRQPTGLPYGEGAQLAQAQRTQPLPDTKPVATPQITQGPGLNAAAQEEPPPSVNEIAKQHNFNPVNIGAPTQRPNEPVTAGIRLGPGPGPEALGPRSSQGRVSNLLSTLATQTGNVDLARLASHARNLGQ